MDHLCSWKPLSDFFFCASGIQWKKKQNPEIWVRFVNKGPLKLCETFQRRMVQCKCWLLIILKARCLIQGGSSRQAPLQDCPHCCSLELVAPPSGSSMEWPGCFSGHLCFLHSSGWQGFLWLHPASPLGPEQTNPSAECCPAVQRSVCHSDCKERRARPSRPEPWGPGTRARGPRGPSLSRGPQIQRPGRSSGAVLAPKLFAEEQYSLACSQSLTWMRCATWRCVF